MNLAVCPLNRLLKGSAGGLTAQRSKARGGRLLMSCRPSAHSRPTDSKFKLFCPYLRIVFSESEILHHN